MGSIISAMMAILKNLIHHGVTETRRFVIGAGLALLLYLFAASAQNAPATSGADVPPVSKVEMKPQIVPITEEHHHHLVLENEYVRVFHVEVPAHSETRFHQHDMDYVFVTLGDSLVESERVGEKRVKLELKDGDTRFTKGGFAHKAVNLSDKPFVNVTVELKKRFFDSSDILCGESVQKPCPGIYGKETSSDSPSYVLRSRNLDIEHRTVVAQNSSLNLCGSAGMLVVFVSKGELSQLNGEKILVRPGDIRWIGKNVNCQFETPGSLDYIKFKFKIESFRYIL